MSPVGIWNRWLATNIHLDQSSPLRKQWYPLCWVLGREGKTFSKSASWWAACPVGDVALLSLWKSITKLLRSRLFNKSIYMTGRCAEGIFALCYSDVDLLLLDRRCLGRGCSGCSVLLLSFWTDCEEAKFGSMRYYLATLFMWNSSWNYLWYSIEMTPQKNNDTAGSRLINSMALPHIWLAQENTMDI